MADHGVVASRAQPLRTLVTRLPWWVLVTAIFVVSRIITTTLMLRFAAMQQTNAWTGANPSYADFASMWDGNWYWIVAASGYPTELPLTADGHVAENAWAFLPAYPTVIRTIMVLTGGDFKTIAILVSLAFALATALMFYKLMNAVLPAGSALFAVVLFCVAPLSPILQVAYAESMFAFFLTLCLYLLVTRRYVLMIPAVTVMVFTRPGALALALALGLHVIHRWVTRERDPFPIRERVASVVVTLYTAVAGFAWLLIAGFVTGSLTAYTDTELSWRMPYVGYGELIPLTPWVQGSLWWSERWGIPQSLGIVLLIALVGGFIAFMFSPWLRKLGVDIRFWVASFVLYILAVFFPQSSVFRILMPTFPLLGAFAVPTNRVYRVAIVVVFIVLQWVWLYIGWWVDGYDWTPP